MTDHRNEPAPTTVTLTRADARRGVWWLTAALCVGMLFSVSPAMCPNDQSRWDTVWSLAEFRTFQIFDTDVEARKHGKPEQFSTIDKIYRADIDAYQSSKPPALPAVAAGVVWTLQRGMEGVRAAAFRIDPSLKDSKRFTVAITKKADSGDDHGGPTMQFYFKTTLMVLQVLPYLAMLWLYFKWLDRAAPDGFAFVVSLLAMALATPMLGYLFTFNNHVIGGWSAFFAAALVWSIVRTPSTSWLPDWRYVVAGLFAGWAGAVELPGAALVALAAAVLATVNWRATLVLYLPGAVAVVVASLFAVYLATGSWMPAYGRKELYRYEGSYWNDKNPKKSNIDALSEPDDDGKFREGFKVGPIYLSHPYLVHSTIGHHGWFSLHPIFILSAFGMAAWWRRGGAEARAAQFVVLLSAVVMGFYLFIGSERNYGGFCHGMRWWVWLAPLWMPFLPAGVDRVSRMSGGRMLVVLCLVVSVLTSLDSAVNPWTRSWLHRLFFGLGVVDY